MKKQFAVFGLGSFGESIALELQKLGCEVVAVDKDMERVKGIADSVSYAMQADIGDPDFVRSLGTRNLDGVVIAEAESLEASIMATLVCKEIGVPNVIAKAKNERHATVLKNRCRLHYFPGKRNGNPDGKESYVCQLHRLDRFITGL